MGPEARKAKAKDAVEAYRARKGSDNEVEGLKRTIDYQSRDLLRLREANHALRNDALKARARVASLEVEAVERAARELSDTAYLQGKVRRQAQRLKSMEEHRLAEKERAAARTEMFARERDGG